MDEEKPKKKRKKKTAAGDNKERKANWKEYTATVEDIKTFLSADEMRSVRQMMAVADDHTDTDDTDAF